MYAKLADGNLEFAPQNKGAIINYNTNIALMIKDGYKLFVEAKKPVTNRRYHIEYEEKENKISELIVYNESQAEADKREAKEEQDRINNLTMTALDFIGVLQSFGLSLVQINTYLENNLPVKMQLTYCQNVYCGVAKALMPIEYAGITITAEMVEQAFKNKHGEN